jgi:hypothetical protein
VQVPGWAIRSFLTGVIECGVAGMNGDGVVTHLGGNATYALDAIDANQLLHGSLLVRNVRGAVDYNALPDAAYAIQNGIVGPKVHFFSTRWGNRWVTYDAVCWHDRASHYAVSSPMEMFAEMYTKKFTGGSHGMPRANNGWDPGTFFHALEQADPAQLGLPVDTTKQPAPGASRPGAGAPAAAPPTSGGQGPSAPPPGKAIPLS